MRRIVALTVAVLTAAGAATAAVRATTRHPRTRPLAAVQPTTTLPPTTTTTTTLPPTTTTTTSPPSGPVALAGCPPPPPRPVRPGPGPWHPAVLVPDAELPAPTAPARWQSHADALRGKGMWVWKLADTEGGNADAIVAKASAAGLRQVWVRVGDSRDGFYGADVLAALVPRAHARGIAVIAWGFPYLYDPIADARWSEEALAWRGTRGEAIDGFSPDIETASEGVALSAVRAQVYLGALRAAAGNRLLVATVYRPTDRFWATYPYAAIAPYVDAFAPMVYWGCTEPGDAAVETMARLAALRPLHLIGQAYDMGPEGGRRASPSAAEIRRFLDVARRGGAVGASFWVWQSITPDEWTAMATFAW